MKLQHEFGKRLFIVRLSPALYSADSYAFSPGPLFFSRAAARLCVFVYKQENRNHYEN